MKHPQLRILFVTPEVAPWVKTGGLGDVAGALPFALRQQGLDVRVLVPYYPALREAFPDAPALSELRDLGGKFSSAKLRAATTREGLPLLLLDCPGYYLRAGNPYLDARQRDWADNYLRFGLLSRVAAWLGSAQCGIDWHCDIVHGNDWQSALAAAYLRYLGGARARSVMTIHNLAFQGLFERETLQELGLPDNAWSIDGVEFYDRLSFLKAGLQHADAITTVSPTYAKEIQSEEEGMGLHGLLRYRSEKLVGILNGVDTATWNPATDTHLAQRYAADSLDKKTANKTALQREFGLDIDDRLPLFGVVSRLTTQKGLDLIPQIAAAITALPAQLVLLGSGDPLLEEEFVALAKAHPGKIGVRIGFDEGLAHRIEAGIDIFLMPSRFEPCGLNQMYSLRYGTPPVVRATGGLADTVVDCSDATFAAGAANGFVFREASAAALMAGIRRAADLWHDRRRWRRLQRNGMACDFSWNKPAEQYRQFYAHILQSVHA